MIREVDAPLLPFERIVLEEVTNALVEHGFALDPPLAFYQCDLVIFKRERERCKEQIWFNRHVYDKEDMQTGVNSRMSFDVRAREDDEVDRVSDDTDGTPQWASRHRLHIGFVDDLGNSDLLTNGKVGTSNKGEDWFYFENEDDLRRVLRELLPHILTAGLEHFDDAFEEMRTGRVLPSKPFIK